MEAWERYLYIIAFIVVMVLNYGSNGPFTTYKCNEENDCEKLLKKDIVYCFIIFFLFVVGLLTWKLGDNKTVFDQISFAGTISSIILSVIAIFMTIASENKNTSMSGIIEKAKDSIVDADEDIQNNTKKLSKSINKNKKILDVINQHFGKFDDLEKRITDLRSGVEEFRSILDENTQNYNSINNRIEKMVEQLDRIENDTHNIVGLNNKNTDLKKDEKREFKYRVKIDDFKKLIRDNEVNNNEQD